MADFDMPKTGTWAQRGGWVIKRLANDLSLTTIQAAGIVGNLGYESVGFTKLHEIGQSEGFGGYGWGQWTTSRRVAFLAYAEAHKLDWKSDEANYGYLLSELKGAYHNTVAALMRISSIGDAVWSVGQTYERPGGTTTTNLPGYKGRLSYAELALDGAQAEPAPTIPVAAAPVAAPIDDEVTVFKTAVSRIQTFLKSKGDYDGDIDGDFGPASRQALADYLHRK